MNGNWYPWGTMATTTPAEFVAAWRHVHNMFAAGATNVTWVWYPNVVNPMPTSSSRRTGRAAPTWTGSASPGTSRPPGPTPSPGSTGRPSPRSGFTSKPFIIAETAVETGPDEVQSIRNLIGGVEASSDVLGFVWFDYNKAGVDWTVADRPKVRAAVASGIAGMHLVSLSG